MADITRRIGNGKNEEMFLKSIELMAIKYGIEKYAVVTDNSAKIKNERLCNYQAEDRLDIMKAVLNS